MVYFSSDILLDKGVISFDKVLSRKTNLAWKKDLFWMAIRSPGLSSDMSVM